ncbi:hypothetical protein BGZ63DRAFT_350598 [Mariannaea sp. PMI_226]|nr:hypothetical protein BGZ63DRAFT_350598 [Mariannaea sp. PMI_226]
MSQEYAKDQPQGFTNKIERVAIVGAGGSVGKHLAASLIKTGKHTVTAISREGSTSSIPDGVKVVNVDYDNEDSLVNALKGQQFLAISMSVRAPPDTQEKIVRAAAKAGVKWIMPNAYGTDVANTTLTVENFTRADAGIHAIQKVGYSSWIAMVCGFWYEFSTAQPPEWYGFDIAKKTATFYDDGKTRINTSTWIQCGEALAGLLSLKELPDDENDQSPNVSQWKNKPLYISSFRINQREMLDSIQRVTGTTDKDWTIDYEDSKDRWVRGKARMQSGDRLGHAMAMYARTFFPNGDGDFETKYGLANDVLSLPKEDLDEASKRAVAMVEGGYNYFTNRM